MAEKKKFTPADLLFNSSVRTVEVPGLGTVQYVPLTTRETVELAKESGLDRGAMNAKEAWLMLKKANPDMMQFEEFFSDATDGDKVATLIKALLEERVFRA